MVGHTLSLCREWKLGRFWEGRWWEYLRAVDASGMRSGDDDGQYVEQTKPELASLERYLPHQVHSRHLEDHHRTIET